MEDIEEEVEEILNESGANRKAEMALLIACSVFVARGGTPKKLIAALEREMEAVKK